jgi:predicted RNA-binding protein with PUA-like domain
MKTSKNYWLMKSEPETWSWEQQKKKKVEHWDGVRNYQAANYMKANEKRR